MARVKTFDKGSQNVGVHPTEVDCFYQVISDKDGRRFLHLTTFGSDSRESQPKSSQSLQLNQEAAWELVKIIGRVFGER